jgi:hypothetical protein
VTSERACSLLLAINSGVRTGVTALGAPASPPSPDLSLLPLHAPWPFISLPPGARLLVRGLDLSRLRLPPTPLPAPSFCCCRVPRKCDWTRLSPRLVPPLLLPAVCWRPRPPLSAHATALCFAAFGLPGSSLGVCDLTRTRFRSRQGERSGRWRCRRTRTSEAGIGGISVKRLGTGRVYRVVLEYIFSHLLSVSGIEVRGKADYPLHERIDQLNPPAKQPTHPPRSSWGGS